MSTTTSRLLTAGEFAEFVDRPENANRLFELIEGEVVELTRPKPLHGLVCATVSALLWAYCRSWKRGYVLSNDTGLILARDPDTVRGPDIMLYDDGKTFEELKDEDAYPETPPLLAVEILSPSDRPGPVVKKVQQYLDAGVRLVWVLDPERREVLVYRPGTETDVLGPEATLDGGAELPGFSLTVVDLFRAPGET